MTDTNQGASTPTTLVDSGFSRFISRTRAVRVPVLVVCLTVAAYVAGTNGRPSDAADPPAKQQSTDAQYAQVFLDLAEAQLAYAERMNRQSAGTFSQEQLTDFRRAIELWSGLLKQEVQSGRFNRIAALQGLAQQRLQQAKTAVANAEQLNQRVPGTVAPERLKELRAFVALAQLDATSGSDVETADPTDQLRWRVQVLEDEMLLLRKEVDLIRRTQQ